MALARGGRLLGCRKRRGVWTAAGGATRVLPALLAGFGVGGLAVALAAQPTIENLIGSLTIYADRPVRVGDLCRFGTHMGFIEQIGLRSTRIRTFERTVVTIPNGVFAKKEIENYTRRNEILLKTVLGLRYETTNEQLKFVLVRLRELLLGHPRVSDIPARVRFIGFGDYSLDVEVFAYIRERDRDKYLAVREDLMLRMMQVVEEAGTGFAFPSQTTYLSRDGGLDADRQKEAESQVEGWRSEGRLPFPEFDNEHKDGIRDSLDYPPKGSPQSKKD